MVFFRRPPVLGISLREQTRKDYCLSALASYWSSVVWLTTQIFHNLEIPHERMKWFFFQGEEFFESWCIGGLVKQRPPPTPPTNLHDPVSPLLPSTAAHCPRPSCGQSAQSQAALGTGLTPSLAAVSEQGTGGQRMDSLSAAFSTERSGFFYYRWASCCESTPSPPSAPKRR